MITQEPPVHGQKTAHLFLLSTFSKKKSNPGFQPKGLNHWRFGKVLFWANGSAASLSTCPCRPCPYHTNRENPRGCVLEHTRALWRTEKTVTDTLCGKQRRWYLCSVISETLHTFLVIKLLIIMNQREHRPLNSEACVWNALAFIRTCFLIDILWQKAKWVT